MIRYETRNGYAGQIAHCAKLALPAVQEFSELRQGERREDVYRVVGSMSEHDRIEVLAFDGHELVGATIIVPDHDQHVGHCLNLQWQYVRPGYRNGAIGRTFIRELLRQAQWAGIKNVCYTHRVGVGRYTMTYREVRNGQKAIGRSGRRDREEGAEDS